jgi:enoyl-CoA hydratase
VDYQFILVERVEPIAVLTLNRPQQLNALNWTLIGELADACETLDRDDAIRCLVITGAGDRAFAAGADIKEMAGQTPVSMMTGEFEGWDRLRRIHKPIIAAVGGFALGGGLELAMHCDLIIASENARFGQPEINLGIIPGAGGTQRLARNIGKFVAMEMVLTGRNFTAEELYRLGLVNAVVPAGQHLDKAKEVARTIAAKGPVAVRLAKEAILAAFEMPQEQGLMYEKRLFATLFSTEDQKEGMAAFVEKRPADFKGH